MAVQLNISANRAASKWSRKELIGRLLWALIQPLFRYSPRLCWGWRRLLLRTFGAQVGAEVHVHPSVRIAIPWNLEIGDWSAIGFDVLIYNLGSVRLGQRVTVSHRAHLCAGTHDYRDPAMPLIKRPIEVQDDAWICAEAFVGPGVQVANGAVVGACAAVVKDVAAWTIVAGNPAREVGVRSLF